MIEVELKFRASDPAAVRTQLQQLGGKPEPGIEQVDTYFAHPVRDFAKTDEALRIRVVRPRACVTYKGPLLDSVTKSREETEVWLEGGDDTAPQFAFILEHLGFRPVRNVSKRREPWTLSWKGHDVEVAIDIVEELGEFIELETSSEASGFDEARQALLSLAHELKLQHSERRSYLALLMGRS